VYFPKIGYFLTNIPFISINFTNASIGVDLSILNCNISSLIIYESVLYEFNKLYTGNMKKDKEDIYTEILFGVALYILGVIDFTNPISYISILAVAISIEFPQSSL
jgi:hypothetical protein